MVPHTMNVDHLVSPKQHVWSIVVLFRQLHELKQEHVIHLLPL